MPSVNVRTFGFGVVDEALQPCKVVIVYDPRVVGVVRDIRIEPFCLRRERHDELLDTVLGDQCVVRRHAGLAAIGELAKGDAPCRFAQRVAVFDDDGRLAAKLERDRHQVLARRAHYGSTDRDAPGEQQAVEGKAGEGASYLYHSDHLERRPLEASLESKRQG